MLYNLLLGLETILAVVIVVLILLHRGRGSEAGAVFTGTASASVFGSRGSASFLTKLIASLAFVFILNSLSLAYIANRDFGSGSVLKEVNTEEQPPADDFPIDEDISIDELIDDIPVDPSQTELNNDTSDIPTLDEDYPIEQPVPADSAPNELP